MTDSVQPPADEPAQPAAAGRHGGGAGVSAAELIARSKAASSEAGPRSSRSSRRAARAAEAAPSDADPAATTAPPATATTAPIATTAPPAATVESAAPPAATAPPDRHLRVVETARSTGSDKPARTGLALVEPQRTGQALTTATPHPPEAPNGRRPVSPTEAAAASISTPEIAKPPRKNRSGRNLPAAIGVGASLALLVVATLAVYRPSFVVLLSIAVAIGVYEMVTAVGTVEARPPLVPLLAGVLAMEAAAWFRGPDGLVGALLLTVLGVTIWRLADGASGYLRDVASANLVALYIPFLAGFATLMAHADDGAARIVLFVLTVVCSDTGGYAVGVLFGKHPMAPTVSPKKSWEGFFGSLLAGSIAGVLMMVFCFHQQWWQGALFGVAIVATATLGDLGESMIKRDLGLKDMGKLLPGHGGVMDRLDSLLPCAPVAYLLLAAFLPG
ncbi:MAG TPA: phosphatidate cytidylyltransferase [Jatrophihabitans sp.]|jgi:phosphatidate cytidylyltransferase|uniref:phosphatidate cytidylyltransferase n=1 Tax=Jatrophihabitans sp. TaxID=1932789 RepID=UPI002EF996A6